MKSILTLILVVGLLSACTADHKQVKWKAVVTADQPMYSVFLHAERPGSDVYTDDTGEGYSQSTYEHEFKASKINDIEILVTTYSAGNINVKLYQKNDLVDEKNLDGSPDGTADQNGYHYKNY